MAAGASARRRAAAPAARGGGGGRRLPVGAAVPQAHQQGAGRRREGAGGPGTAPAWQLRVAGRRRDAGVRVLRLLLPPGGLRRQAPPAVSGLHLHLRALAARRTHTLVSRATWHGTPHE